MKRALLAIVAIAPLAVGAEPLELKGLIPGMPVSEAAAKLQGLAEACSLEGPGHHSCFYIPRSSSSRPIQALDTLAGAPVKIWSIDSRDGKISSVYATLTTNAFAMVSGAIEQKYGKPTTSKTSEVHNRMGASFDQVESAWRDGDAILDIRKRSGRIDSMGVSLTTMAEMNARQRDREEKAKKGASDL